MKTYPLHVMMDVFVARQPIFDRNDRLCGYELLYRNTASSTTADGAAADTMCTDTVIHSFRQMLYRWLAPLMVSSMVTGKNDVDDQLAYAALLRARLCELIAESSPNVRNVQAVFMVGLFSMLDVLLRMPMRDIFSRVNVADDIREAVMHGTGPCAEPLRLATAYQHGEWAVVDDVAHSLGVKVAQLPWLYTKSLAWVNEQLRSVRDNAA